MSPDVLALLAMLQTAPVETDVKDRLILELDRCASDLLVEAEGKHRLVPDRERIAECAYLTEEAAHLLRGLGS